MLVTTSGSASQLGAGVVPPVSEPLWSWTTEGWLLLGGLILTVAVTVAMIRLYRTAAREESGK
ncbi:MAG: hypothetical protein EXS00_06495 [Phycisphaerales bacterium]|nr:hypothetical protein [Phycisphaerales bacterium]